MGNGYVKVRNRDGALGLVNKQSQGQPADTNQQADSDKDALKSPFELREDGVYYTGEGGSVRVCSPLKIVAITRDQHSQNYGRWLEWKDTDGNVHRWAMPMEWLAADGIELRKALLAGGLPFIGAGKAKHLLTNYIATFDTKERAICVDRTGWYEESFVLPDSVISNSSKGEVIFQTATGEVNHFRSAGTLPEWNENVARFCIGNSRLIFAVSMAFAAPLMGLTSMDGGGFNFRGNSSEGKSTAAQVAASACGGREFVCAWRATSNGLEGVAAAHNDALLVLDEMSQVDAKEAGEIAYMLANGQGKQRAGRSGSARAKRQWRTLFLSNGEISLAQHLVTTGQKVKAGQEVRLADIPMSTGVHGGFEELHGFPGGGALADHLKVTSNQYYGVALRAYLTKIVDKLDEVRAATKKVQEDFIEEFCPANAQGQVRRVAMRFALVAAGGDYATSAGVTGWPENAAIKAAEICFKAWLSDRGGVADAETGKVLEQVVEFFQANGLSRFSNWNGEDGRTINDRVGYRESSQSKTLYYVYPERFRNEICKGIDYKLALNLLESKGLLEVDKGRKDVARRPPDMDKTMRLYCVKGEVVDG